jgi:hypothetical protein
VFLYTPLPKVFYSSMVYTYLNLLDLISLLCLRHLCRCPLTITFLSSGILSSSIVKFLPFSNLYSLGIDMLVSLDSSILLFQKHTSKNSVAYLNISVFISLSFLSFEIHSYSVVKSLSFNNFYSIGLSMLVSLESCILSYFYVCLSSYPNICLRHFNLHDLDHPCFLMIHERSFYFAHP